MKASIVHASVLTTAGCGIVLIVELLLDVKTSDNWSARPACLSIPDVSRCMDSIARRVNPSAAAVRWGWRWLLPAVAIPSLMPRRNRGQQWLRFDLEAMFWFGVKVADGLGCYRDQGSALAS